MVLKIFDLESDIYIRRPVLGFYKQFKEKLGMLIVRDISNLFQQMSGMPVNSKGEKALLKQSGIDTSSKQYKAAISLMNSSAGSAVGGTPIHRQLRT